MNFPLITEMKVIPVAGYDSFLLNLSGGHGPVFIRNLVVLKDNAGNIGVGETPGGEAIRKTLEDSKEIVIGSRLGEMNLVLNTIGRRFANLDEGGRGQQTFDQRVMIHAQTAIEAAFLDLTGKTLGVPVAELLGDGMQREKVEILGYLFFVGDSKKTNLAYDLPKNNGTNWERIRRMEALDPKGIVEQARATKEQFGFNTFKLKGGVLDGPAECDCISALAETFPDSGLTIDPNGAWSLQQSIDWLTPLKPILTYAEDPCGSERGFSGREILAEFRKTTGIATATNMIATNYKELVQAIQLQALDIPLADCHFWTMQGAVRVSALCELWGLTWGSHSNNHFDVSLAMIAHTAAAAKGNVTPVDTHWIWQVGQRLTKKPMKIKNGFIDIPKIPGLGIELDFEKVEEANKLYNMVGSAKRDDSVAMQFLKPGWKFNPKRPCLTEENE
ncbi:MAG: glucarate dehydratase [Prolixibacteraceae bacterium]|jgi:glucarate dehydratase|nr:glucarate dehydratase [Prolixibacteraceae bacterium]MBT6763868.1 glucarate dehydratase [Prolixibacteraceae bacterium]MBT6999460.1 glucarate dehydratase [Prolixibacteraceae bacterium]MBT7394781.1 glucarate dehydratase [Prolixibacteraceae bacterium]